MSVPKPSEARIVVKHYEDGKMKVFFDDSPIPGVMSATIKQNHNDRSVLTIEIIGMAYRVEQSEVKRSEDRGSEAVDGDDQRPGWLTGGIKRLNGLVP